jgi:hypothetical protein
MTNNIFKFYLKCRYRIKEGGLKKIPILDKRLLEHLYVILYNILEAVINNLKENLRKYHAQNSLVKSINRGRFTSSRVSKISHLTMNMTISVKKY